MTSFQTNCGIPRSVEVVVAALGLVVSVPILAVSAMLVVLTSKGSAIFRQKRVGRNGKIFTLFKLRTMTSGPGPFVTSTKDDRITAIGRILRRSKIDELPQFWNVVRGDMSLVGPRPEVPELVDLNSPDWATILLFRPGLVDPVTLQLRNEELLLTDFANDVSFYERVLQPYKIQGYLRFLRNRTWTADVGTIFRTLTAIVFPASAVPPTPEEMKSIGAR